MAKPDPMRLRPQAPIEAQEVIKHDQPQSADHRLSSRIRLKYGAVMRELVGKRENTYSATAVILVQFAVIAAAALACRSAAGAVPDLAVPLYVLTCFVIGSRMRALGLMLHECAHGTFVSTREGNQFFGTLLSFVNLTDWEEYVSEHATHHRYLGDPELDLEFAGRWNFFADEDKRFSWKHGIKPLSLFHLNAYLQPVIFGGSRPLARLVFVSAVFAAVHYTGLWSMFLLYYVVPYASTYQVIRYWSDALDHAGILNAKEDFWRTRNHIFGRGWLNWLLLPRSDQFHLVHHLFPWLPAGALKEAHLHLIEVEPEYSGRPHSMDFLHEK